MAKPGFGNCFGIHSGYDPCSTCKFLEFSKAQTGAFNIGHFGLATTFSMGRGTTPQYINVNETSEVSAPRKPHHDSVAIIMSQACAFYIRKGKLRHDFSNRPPSCHHLKVLHAIGMPFPPCRVKHPLQCPGEHNGYEDVSDRHLITDKMSFVVHEILQDVQHSQ